MGVLKYDAICHSISCRAVCIILHHSYSTLYYVWFSALKTFVAYAVDPHVQGLSGRTSARGAPAEDLRPVEAIKEVTLQLGMLGSHLRNKVPSVPSSYPPDLACPPTKTREPMM